MSEPDFITEWFDQAKQDDSLDMEILELIRENLNDELDEDNLLTSLIQRGGEQGGENEAD